MSNLEHLAFQTTDDLTLPGLLFEPQTPTKKVALYLHGNGTSSVFYSVSDHAATAKALNDVGIAYFPFNNRGAQVVHKLKHTLPDGTEESVPSGTAFELIKDCLHDIDGAIAYLKTRGYEQFYLIGESTGANKICVYYHYKPKNEIAKYVLVSPGDDSGYFYQELGAQEFAKVVAEAKKQVAKGNGLAIVPPKLMEVTGYMSYQSVLDTLDPDGDYNTFPYNYGLNKLAVSAKPLFGYFSEITTPCLVVMGAQDEYCYDNVPGVVELLKTHKNPKAAMKFTIIPNADHGLHGKYDVLAKDVAAFLSE